MSGFMDIDSSSSNCSSSSSGGKGGLEELPSEIILKILGFCDLRSLRSLAGVNQCFYQLITSNFMVDEYEEGDDDDDMEEPPTYELTDLPSEILLKIFSYLDRKALGRAAQVCHYFRNLVYEDCLWVTEAKTSLVTNVRDREIRERTNTLLSARDQVRVSQNWSKSLYAETKLLVQNVRYMPRIQLSATALWVSWGNRIWSHPRRSDGTVSRMASRVLKSHTNDVSRFVLKNGLLIAGGLDRTLVGWDLESGDFLFAKRYCHKSEISAVDAEANVVVTGSRDRTIKIWAMTSGRSRFPSLRQTINIRDRVWSLATSGTGAFVVGSAGLGGVPALHLLDLETGLPLVKLGQQSLKNGAGTLDLAWQTESTFLSCGYDSFTRLWDVRSGQCIRTWEEPYDEAIYCLATDNNMTLFCGTARFGLVRLWDMRHPQPVQMFYTKHAHLSQSSPVYSVAFDQSNLYVALDQCLNLLSFSGINNQQNLRKFSR